jgi:hypothetical protein
MGEGIAQGVLVQPELEKILLHLAPYLAFGKEVF